MLASLRQYAPSSCAVLALGPCRASLPCDRDGTLWHVAARGYAMEKLDETSPGVEESPTEEATLGRMHRRSAGHTDDEESEDCEDTPSSQDRDIDTAGHGAEEKKRCGASTSVGLTSELAARTLRL